MMTIKEVLFRTRYELRRIRESGVIDQGRYRPKTSRAGRLESIKRLVAFPALALTIQRSGAIVSAAIVLRDEATAACAVITLQIPFFRLTRFLECLLVLASRRFPKPSCEAVVTVLGAVGAPLTPRTSTRTLHLASIALITGSFVLGLGSPAIRRAFEDEHFACPASDLERAAAAVSACREGERAITLSASS